MKRDDNETDNGENENSDGMALANLEFESEHLSKDTLILVAD